LLYDYPNIESKGQYRPDRFYSPFSLKTQVNASFQNLIGAAAQLKSTLILSYPDCGLLASPREVLVRLLRERFSNVEVAAELIHEHSTLGASNGVESAQVKELVFLARP
jgi:adenine-specific DNA-methyltransferase